MTLSQRREKQPIVEEQSDGETQPTYQENVKFTYGGTGIDLGADGSDGSSVATASEGFDSDGNGLANCIAVNVQVRGRNENLAERSFLRVYLSTDAEGESAVNAVTTGPMTVETGTLIAEHTALADFDYMTDENGVLLIELVNTASESKYMVVVYKGNVFVTSILTWA